MTNDDGTYSVTLDFEGAGTEVFINRDWEGVLQVEIFGVVGRTHLIVDLPLIQDLRNFLDDVIQQERGKEVES